MNSVPLWIKYAEHTTGKRRDFAVAALEIVFSYL